MALQNRVTPFGEIISDPARGLMMGNRGGCLHGDDRTLLARRWVSRQWICCRLDFNGRRRSVMSPGCYTELFFLDEATALAAGHRPCFECRRPDARRFADLWAASRQLQVRAAAAELDRTLHAERVAADGGKRLHARGLAGLPDGTMILAPGFDGPHLILGPSLRPWTIAGYAKPVRRPAVLDVDLLTPPAIVAVLERGYRPLLHTTADGLFPGDITSSG